MFHKKNMKFQKIFLSVPPFFFWRRFSGVVLCVLRSFIVFYNPLVIALLTQTRAFYTVFLCVYAHQNWRRFPFKISYYFYTPRAGARAHGRIIFKNKYHYLFTILHTIYFYYSFIVLYSLYVISLQYYVQLLLLLLFI